MLNEADCDGEIDLVDELVCADVVDTEVVCDGVGEHDEVGDIEGDDAAQ